MKIRVSEVTGTIIMIWIVMISGVWSIRLPSVVSVSINCVIAIWMILKMIKNRKYNGFYTAIILSIILISVMIINSDINSWLTYIMIIIFIIYGLYFCNFWSVEKFTRIYCKIIIFITLMSLFGYFFRDYLYKIPGLHPIIEGQSVSYINYYFYLYCIELPDRNCAIFWEPGAFAVFIAIAIYLKLMFDKENIKTNLIIYFIGLITTKSTLGYTVILFAILMYYLQISGKKGVVYKVIVGILIGIILMEIMIDIGAFENIQNKLFSGFNNDPSTRARSIAQLIDLTIVEHNPITGVGFIGYQYQVKIIGSLFGQAWTMAANTFTYMCALFGIPYFLIIIRGLTGLRAKENNKILNITCIIFIIWIFIPQNFVQKPIFYILVFWGYSLLSKKRNFLRIRSESYE
ncbi:hypothetical protein QTH34_09820 [Clostridium perfringens]|uniref:O-antigen ligase family protein n=3 Tax=Clostridium perfringens TaxID=1502 RepID=UPI0018E3FCB0|nr:O-antigen ligase family protein [Clostridium perfringens]ELC8413677.1 hypothetical protein [Clostridium perfringens]MBI6007228.1 hypothetical protein [Clostridium perfringens]MDM0605557.1 hypothetical protein [Clostridium perfringens]MDM0638771.1 hypothetical protein [Clostridium perfringens]HAT4166207.1 hypothetical protein [Clostridium perfringens]